MTGYVMCEESVLYVKRVFYMWRGYSMVGYGMDRWIDVIPGGGPGGFFISPTPRTPSIDCGGALGGGGRAEKRWRRVTDEYMSRGNEYRKWEEKWRE